VPDIPAFIVNLKRLRLVGRFGKFVLRGQLRHPRARIGTSMRELTIDGVRIADDTDCYVIAEIGHNHQGDINKCKDLFRTAKDCGAHAVKLQKRDNRTLFTRSMYDSSYNSENAFGKTYGEHREALEFGRDEYKELQKFCKEIGVTFFSTAFDFNSADFLAELDVPAFKLASGDIINTPLLKHVAKIGKPMVISTGGATPEDVQRAYDAIMPINHELCIMQCTAGYPPAFEELNLRVIETYRRSFPNTVIGFSSHDNGIAMALIAYMLGSRMVEKHFTLNRAWKGSDQAFSLERGGMRRMVRDLQRARISLGDGIKRVYPSEMKPLEKMAKKIVAARDLPAGHVLTRDDLALKSPNDGLPPYELDNLIGKRLRVALKADATLAHNQVEKETTGSLSKAS
jgi:sialic acid synthase